MKIPRFSFLPILVSIFSYCSVVAQPAGMSLVWNDEFNVDGPPDSGKWSFDVDGNEWAWGNNELQNYTPADHENPNAWVEAGNLIIEARNEVYTHSGYTRNYTSARLRTVHQGDWLYGRIEVRAKLPRGRGTWPAIWMLPTDWEYGNWPDSGEIDIMEHVGYDMNVVHGTVHTRNFNHTLGTQVGKSINVAAVDQKFHEYNLEWRPGRIDVFVDDTHYFSFEDDGTGFASWPFDKRFHLILNIAVGGNWAGVEGVDDSIFPQRMEVDYVRVYAFDDVNEGFVHAVPGSFDAVQYTASTGVEVETTTDVGGGLSLGWIQGGDSVSYKLNVQEAGQYRMDLRYASPQGVTGVKVMIDGVEALQLGHLDATGGWQNWKTATVGSISLTEGSHQLTFEFTGANEDDLNLNRVSLFPPIDSVHRFYNPQNGAYFFTGFNQEAQSVLSNLPQWQYDGTAFSVEYGPTSQNHAVYRFFNNRSGSHFYTANDDERDNVIANLSHQFSYEGIAFFVQTQPTGLDPVSQQMREFFPIWRFFLSPTSSHYFTGNPEEVQYIQTFVSPEVMRFEGVAWYSDQIFGK